MMAIYAIRNLRNGKRYIGSSVNVLRRFREHKNRLASSSHHSAALQRSWQKHGPDFFSFEVLEEVEDAALLIKREQFWLDHFRPFEKTFGYNIRRVAESSLGVKRTPEQRERLRVSLREAMARPEVRAKLREARAFTSPEHREKIAASKRGKARDPEMVKRVNAKLRNPSPETLAKMSAASAGRSDETKRKIAASLSGRKLAPHVIEALVKANKGKVVSAETREKIANSKRGKPRDAATKEKLRVAALAQHARRRAA